MDTRLGATEPLPNFEATAQVDTAFSESCVKATDELVTPLRDGERRAYPAGADPNDDLIAL